MRQPEIGLPRAVETPRQVRQKHETIVISLIGNKEVCGERGLLVLGRPEAIIGT